MELFTVEEYVPYEYSCDSLFGVFDSEEKAKDYKQQLIDNGYDGQYLYIDTYDLNKGVK